MASAIVSKEVPLVLPEMEPCSRAEGAAYLSLVSRFVSENRHKVLTLKRPAGVKLRFAQLSDTIYKENHKELRKWGKFYLPHQVNMQVVGTVEDGCGRSILMTCEDKKLYVHDGEELHEVASSLEQLRRLEIEYPASKTYREGDAFKDMTAEDWHAVRSGELGRRLDQDHQKFVQANKATFLELLRSQK